MTNNKWNSFLCAILACKGKSNHFLGDATSSFYPIEIAEFGTILQMPLSRPSKMAGNYRIGILRAAEASKCCIWQLICDDSCWGERIKSFPVTHGFIWRRPSWAGEATKSLAQAQGWCSGRDRTCDDSMSTAMPHVETTGWSGARSKNTARPFKVRDAPKATTRAKARATK